MHPPRCMCLGSLSSACMHTTFLHSVIQACHISLLIPPFFPPLYCTHTLTLTHTHTHTHTHAHAHALLSSKGSVAYKLAAVSSQSLCAGRGRKDKLLRLDGTELNQASLDWVILGWGLFFFNGRTIAGSLLAFTRQSWAVLGSNRLN